MMDPPSDAELRALISQLTLSEKISMLSGKNVWETFDVERLGIPSLKVTDGPNGARGGSFFDGTTAACFPSCVSLAATFNRDLASRIGAALGQEAETKGAYVVLGPTVCGHRSPLGGRNFEAFSEDPLLSGALAAEYVKGLQSQRVGATVKHFVANEQDTKRFTVNETISERALREIYLRPFEIVVKSADPWCIMTSYPKVNGRYVDAQPTFINDILRKEWGFQGLVMSDWGATSDAVSSIKYGLNLEMPGPPNRRKPEVVQKAVDEGLVKVNDIDEHIFSLLNLLRRTGKFSDRREPRDEQAIMRPEHNALIREAGAEGIVLLKNPKRTLPIDTKNSKKIALLGPLATHAAAHGGGSASLNCHYKVTPYDAFHQRLGQTCELSYSKGTHIFRVLPDLEAGAVNRNNNPGFIADFFRHPDLSGEPFYHEEYPRGAFTTLMNTKVAGIAKSVRFTTKYNPPASGKHYLSFSGLGPSKLFIDGELVSNQIKETKDSMGFLLGVQDEHRFQYDFDANKLYDVVIESIPSQVNNSDLFLLEGQIAAHLGFVAQAEMEADLLAEAAALAKGADIAICFVGNTAQWETEGQDMASMTLPADGSQDRLITEVAKANANTIVVITTGVPVEMPWLDQVSAVLQGWYAGQEIGNAIADVILGDVNPSGKLPVSWPRKYEHTACFGHFGLDSFETQQVTYVEGVYVGYRHFDQMYETEKEVLFPFGFGLSYSTFEISSASLEGSFSQSTDGPVDITVKIQNTSTRKGAETLQVYLTPPNPSSNGRPPKSLVAFEKVSLEPNEKKDVRLSFKKDAAAYWIDLPAEVGGQVWRVEGGRHEVLICTSSNPSDIHARCALEITEGFDFNP
ncbi:unnamed protein product [Clonostachys byssicola]|uniref:beta-glucosidase n=1 Tax=Clonostachys byssicola TaxID=160290 RepID=A0A9N9V1A1_9HYPO|nr:unnamed protein product [Clonostachys byssicola]